MPGGRRPGGVGGVRPKYTNHIQCAYCRAFVVARLDPDGNEISTDEEEMIERARTITRRNNPQSFFSLFQPVDRPSNDGPTTSRNDTGAFEAQRQTHSARANAVQSSGTAEGTLEVTSFLEIPREMNTDGAMSIHNAGFPRIRLEPCPRCQLHQPSAYAPSRNDLFPKQKNRAPEI